MTRDIDLDRIKRLAIVAMFSDDSLMGKLVLKGGNLLDLIYGISTRASLDVDLSIDGDLESLDDLAERVERAIKTTFGDEQIAAFDVNVVAVPPKLSDDMKSFWGGYKISFKLLNAADYDKFNTLDERRRNAISVGKRGSTKFCIDLSRHEYCAGKETRQLYGYTIFVYSPLMFVAEKLRSICQQMPAYAKQVASHASARARDFIDIEVATEKLAVNFGDPSFHQVLRDTFSAKRVPLHLIGKIAEQREYHRGDFASVLDTLKPGVTVENFDYYCDYVINKCAGAFKIEPDCLMVRIGEVQFPQVGDQTVHREPIRCRREHSGNLKCSSAVDWPNGGID